MEKKEGNVCPLATILLCFVFVFLIFLGHTILRSVTQINQVNEAHF